jgi:hypothetical protein
MSGLDMLSDDDASSIDGVDKDFLVGRSPS